MVRQLMVSLSKNLFWSFVNGTVFLPVCSDSNVPNTAHS